jgi:hypothetical protein
MKNISWGMLEAPSRTHVRFNKAIQSSLLPLGSAPSNDLNLEKRTLIACLTRGALNRFKSLHLLLIDIDRGRVLKHLPLDIF